MDLELLRMFAAAAETEHITKAAERLYLSQSSLSASIGKLERILGVALFERRSNRVYLSDAGRFYYKRIAPLIAALDELDAQFSAIRLEQQHRLYIRSPELYTFPGLVDEILTVNREICFSYRLVPRSEVSASLCDGRLDFVIDSTGYRENRSICRELYRCGFSFVAGRGNPLFGNQNVSLEQLSGQKFVLCSDEVESGVAAYEMISAMGFSPTVAYEVTAPDRMAEIAASSTLVALMPQVMIPSDGRLWAFWPQKTERPVFTLYLSYNNTPPVKPARDLAIELIGDYFQHLC